MRSTNRPRLDRRPFLDTLSGLRDRALLLTGFAGGMRRGELAGLDVADVEFVHNGATVTIKRSKSD